MGSHPTSQELSALIGGLLSVAETARLGEHLAACERCRGEIAALRGMGLSATAGALADTHTSSPSSSAPEAGIAIGTEVGRYRVTRRLGQGAMGQVFAAHDPRLDRQVAIKLLRHDVPAVENKPLRLRLEREAQALARLSHPNVVAVHDLGDHGDSLFIAMDYVEGETLSDWLRVPRPWREVQRVFLQAGAGLAAAHRAGLVHRDFKPDNVLVGIDGVARVSDFGVSRRVDTRSEGPGDEDTITGAGSLIGTPVYMSPEQFDGASADARSDQYGFCATLFEALAGRRPYDAPSLRELRDVVHAGGARFPDDSTVPKWLQALVLRGISVPREARFPSMDELLLALRGPRRWSRPLLLSLAGVAVLGVVAFALGARELERRRTDPCLQVDERATDAWNPARLQRLAAGVDAINVPWGADAKRRLVSVFDAFVSGWRTDYRNICAEVDRTSGPERSRALAQQACLDARLDSFRRYQRAFETADASMLRDGPRNVAAALAARGCSGIETALDVPEDPQQRAAFTRLRERYFNLEADTRLARGGDVRAELKACREEADAQGFRSLGASLRLLEGWSVVDRANLDAAITIFDDAVLRAEVARDDTVMFIARLELTKVLAESVDVKRARAMVPAVRASAQRLGINPDEQHEVLQLEATVLSMEGKQQEAIEKVRVVIALRGDDPMVFLSWTSLSAMQSQLGLHDESLQSIAKAKDLGLKALGAHHPAYGSVLLSEAAALNRAQRRNESFASTEQALAIFEKDPDTRSYVAALFNYSVMLNRTERRDQALPLMRKAVTLAEARAEVTRLATMQCGYAETLQEAGRLDEALVYSQKALVTAERAAGPTSIHLARPLAVHGALLEELKRYAEAADVLDRALQIQQGPEANPVLRDITRYDLARVRWQDPAKRRAAVDEVTAVRAAFVSRGERFKPYVAECDQWLRKHPPK